MVWTTVSCSRVSAIDRLVRLNSRFARAPSVLKSRSSGCENESRQPRPDERIVAVQEAVAAGVRGIPRHAVGAAEPWQPLIQPDVRGDDVVARGRRNQEAARRLQLVVARHARVERRPEDRRGPRDARIADLRVDPRGRELEVVLQRHPNRVIDGELQR